MKQRIKKVSDYGNFDQFMKYNDKIMEKIEPLVVTLFKLYKISGVLKHATGGVQFQFKDFAMIIVPNKHEESTIDDLLNN